MPVLDKFLKLIDAYSPTATGTNWQSSNWYDGQVAQDYGMGQGPFIGAYFQISATVTGNATSTLQFKVQGATDSAFTSPVDIIATPIAAMLQANFATQGLAGADFKVKFPRGFSYRYLRAVVVISTATLTAGTFNCWLGDNGMFQDNKTYPGNYVA